MHKLIDNLTLNNFNQTFLLSFYLGTHTLPKFQAINKENPVYTILDFDVIVCCQDSKASQSSFNFLERHFLEKSRQTKMLLLVWKIRY